MSVVPNPFRSRDRQARDSNFELTFNLAGGTRRHQWQIVRAFCITNWIIPPDSMKWSMSATVKTLEPSKAANMEGSRFFSDALINKI